MELDASIQQGVEPAADQFPSARITASHLRATVALPDAHGGYYRGTRFDWGGVVTDMRWRGHRLFDEWFAVHDHLLHDGICGPVDEFSQVGYEQTPIGGEFLKIGVGTLRKSSTQPYDRFKYYEIVDAGQRSVNVGRESVEFRHQLVGERYGYIYDKTLVLHGERPGFGLEYRLKNLGPEPIVGSLYNHNFFTLDNMRVGPDTAIRFPFRPEGDWREEYASVELTGDGIRFLRELSAGESVFMGNLHGPKRCTTDGYRFELLNTAAGVGVRVQGSGHLTNIVFWASPMVACVEPYTDLRVYPGETASWRVDYRLFET